MAGHFDARPPFFHGKRIPWQRECEQALPVTSVCFAGFSVQICVGDFAVV